MPNKKRRPTNPKKIKFSAEDMHELTSPGTRHGVRPFVKGLVGGPPAMALDLMTNAAYGADQMVRGYGDAAKTTGKNVVSGVRNIGSFIKDRDRRRRNMKDVGSELKKIIGRQQGGRIPNMNQQQYPMRPMADALASQGRYGDTELVHVNKDELQGLASLVPNGRLTTNPMTGQPEAFLVTLLGSILGKSLLAGKFAGGLGGLIGAGGLSSSAAGAIGSGIAATAATGDVKKGLVSAVTGYGLGQVMGGLGDAVPDATALGESGIEASKLAVQESGTELLKQGGAPAFEALKESVTLTDLPLSEASGDLFAAGTDLATKQAALEAARTSAAKGVGSALREEGFKGTLKNLTDVKGITSGIMEPSAIAAIGVGEGTRGQMMAQEETERAFEESERQREEDYRRNMANITGAESQLSEDYPGAVAYPYDPDPYQMGSSYGSEYAAASGGIVSLNPKGYEDAYNGLMQLGGSPVRMRRGGRTPIEDPDEPKNPAVLFGPGTPASRQSKLRPPRVVTPEELEGYRPGIDPEIMYFRKPIATESDTSANTTSRPPINTGSKGGRPNLPGYGEVSMSDVLSTGAGSLGAAAESPIEDFGYMPEFVQRPDRFKRFQNISSEEPVVSAAETQTPLYTQEDSSIRIGQGSPLIMDQVVKDETTTEPFVIPKSVQDEIAESMEGIGGPRSMRFMNEGGMASLDQQSQGIGALVNQPIQPESPTEDPIIDQIIMVILGRIEGEQADAILNAFISTYGEEAYLALRDQVLTSVVPDAQTEGVIDGAGGGMDDMVQGMIGDQQRVAVSPGEYIVAADVVSGLGDGNTDSGADRLDKMVDMVRMQKNGTLKQPDRLKEGEVSV